MCRLCEKGFPQDHTAPGTPNRRDFLKVSAAAAAGVGLLSNSAAAQGNRQPPPQGRQTERFVIRNGHVMSMDPAVGNFDRADVLVDGTKIVAVGPNLPVHPSTPQIDATGRIVMPGFIDTHHHQFETALRSFLANGLLINDGTPAGTYNYFEYILLRFAPVYRPEDVYINELFGSLSQLDAGVTTTLDISQIHHTPQHSDAAITALRDAGRRAAFGYFESASGVPGNQYPEDAYRIRKQWFSSDDQLVSMIMGGEIYVPNFERAWAIGRDLNLPIAAHILSPFGLREPFDALAASGAFGPDNIFIHMTGMSDMAWERVRDAGSRVSLAVPIEMNMRHGMPPILKVQEMGIKPSLSVDVECTLTADMFTQMRSTMNVQRALVNQMVLDSGLGVGNWWPDGSAFPAPLTTQQVLEYATMNGARDLRLDHKVGSLTPGKEADIILLDAEAINVAPLNNVPGAVVSLMERSNVETVIVAGTIRKWKGQLLDVDLPKLRRELEASRDYIFAAANVPQDLYREY